VLSTAGIFTECFQENFLPNGVFLSNSAHRSVSFLYQFLVLTDGCPATATYLASTQALRSQRVSSASKSPDYIVAHRSDGCSSPVKPVSTGQTRLELLNLRLRFFGLGLVDQPRNQVVFWRTTGNPRTQCSLRQSPLMTRLPGSPGSTLVLRLNQVTAHDFILLFIPPCGPHLTPLETGSLERSLLVFSTP
jgi:hypothetical protein